MVNVKKDVRRTAFLTLLLADLFADGLGLMDFKVHMGWSTLDTVLTYADEDYERTASSVRHALG
ncbi:hypothetical protein SAMN05216388_101774 [Halorientalis persicus]|uniref:Phage integrase family protein n=1 Tax=Halorientalis persicus TaxID=1367881 RepID=A0A1H8RXR1_9EURY|nr:hypothetical protein [Halorientalis persicus]SEO71160.1 hypothetical protein SAMN05216388_101774 [Halorientalis persicus]